MSDPVLIYSSDMMGIPDLYLVTDKTMSHHGWLMFKHPDGQLVSLADLKPHIIAFILSGNSSLYDPSQKIGTVEQAKAFLNVMADGDGAQEESAQEVLKIMVQQQASIDKLLLEVAGWERNMRDLESHVSRLTRQNSSTEHAG